MKIQARWLVPLSLTFAIGACAPDDGVDDDLEIDDTEVGQEVSELPYADWDADGDDRLASDEFGGWARERAGWADWNTDNDGTVGEEEFAGAVLGIWDDNDDDLLTEQEWNENVGDWIDPDRSGEFTQWDANADGAIDRMELQQGFARIDFFGDWDLNDDDGVDENEFGEGLFGIFDRNDDDYLDDSEWTAAEEWGM